MIVKGIFYFNSVPNIPKPFKSIPNQHAVIFSEKGILKEMVLFFYFIFSEKSCVKMIFRFGMT